MREFTPITIGVNELCYSPGSCSFIVQLGIAVPSAFMQQSDSGSSFPGLRVAHGSVLHHGSALGVFGAFQLRLPALCKQTCPKRIHP